MPSRTTMRPSCERARSLCHRLATCALAAPRGSPIRGLSISETACARHSSQKWFVRGTPRNRPRLRWACAKHPAFVVRGTLFRNSLCEALSESASSAVGLREGPACFVPGTLLNNGLCEALSEIGLVWGRLARSTRNFCARHSSQKRLVRGTPLTRPRLQWAARSTCLFCARRSSQKRLVRGTPRIGLVWGGLARSTRNFCARHSSQNRLVRCTPLTRPRLQWACAKHPPFKSRARHSSQKWLVQGTLRNRPRLP